MATLGVVPFGGIMATSHGNKLQLLGHSESAIVNNGERREIIILRRKNNTPLAEASKSELDCGSDSVNSIAETIATSTVLVSSNQAKFSKKKPSMNLPRAHHQPPPVAVARRNARERNRVKQVNNGFAILRQHIPLSVSSNYSSDSAGSGSRASRKLSKVETLRMAVDYIRSLQQMLSMDDGGNSESGATSSTSISHAHLHSPNSASSSSDTSSPSPKITSGASPQPSPNSITSTDPRCPPSYCPSETIPNDYEPTTPSVLIEDDDDDTSSFIDPASPSSSATLKSTSSANFASPPQYHYRSALPRTSSLIQLMGNSTIGSYAHDGTGFVPLNATATLKNSTEEYLDASHHELGRLQLHQHLASTVEDTYHPEDLALLGARLHHSPSAPTTANSLSPGVYSEQSLSPETAIATADVPSSTIGVGISSSSTFLPAFSSALSRVSPRASALHLITSTASPIQYVSSSTLHSAVVAQHEAYPQPVPAGIELLSHVKMEMEETNGNTEDIAGGDEVVIVEGGAQGAEMLEVMSWWEQEQRLRLITAPNAPPSS